MRKIKISIILFLIIVLSTLTTVYAWIALANVNKIENISLNAVANYELLMSIDGENFYTEIPKEIILQELKHLKFDDVTSDDGKTFYNYYEKRREARKNIDYISFTIYFQTTSRYTELHLSDNQSDINYDYPPEIGTYIVSQGRHFKSEVDFLYNPNDIVKAGEIRQYFAHNAMRTSFYNEEENIAKIFDLSGDELRGYGKAYGAVDYYNKTSELTLDLPETFPNTIYDLSTFSETAPYALTDSSYLLTLIDKGNKTLDNKNIKEGKLEMNIWLEGWDADAFDAILSDKLKMQFMFRAVMPKQ